MNALRVLPATNWRRLKASVAVLFFLLAFASLLMADSTTVINEVHYHPVDASQTEWIELANTMSYDMDLGGWKLTGAVDYTFPTDTVIAAGRFVVVAADPAKVQLRSIFEEPLGPFEGRLSNQGERIELRNVSGRLMSWVDYNDREPWPVAADGSGATLAKIDPETNSASVESWRASEQFGGTPGGGNFTGAPESSMRINELDPAGWIEIANPGEAANLVDHLIGVAGDVNREVLLPDLPIDGSGFTVISKEMLGFEIEEGDLVCLYAPNKARVLDAVLADTVVRGRSEEHADRWLYPTASTPGEVNAFALEEAVVINEIMYRPYPLAASPATPPVFEEQDLSGPNSNWRFWQGTPQTDDAWRQLEFDPAEWEEGGPPFSGGNTVLPGDAGEPTSLRIGKSAYYFRLTFEVDAIGEGQTMQLQHLVDDGAAFYLNGEEITRFNLPEGEVTGSTRATDPVENPAWSEALVIPAERLWIGQNVLAAEVHQSSALDRDVAFSAAVSLGKLLELGLPAQPFRDGPEEWIELYNRSERAVDLSGWSLREGIRFDFPEGTQLAPQAYLVVANDAAMLREKYPDLQNVLGDFEGSLSNSGENVILRDRRRNPADAVRYYDGGRWPVHADGGGSSLELVDPEADNAVAEAWAASDEGAKAAWQEIRYRMISDQTYGLNTWNELRIGMLSAGEILIDDVRVLEDPDGAAKQLVQNGEFKNSLFNPDVYTNRWRFVGNHRHTHAVPDPENPDNHVLHLIASGSTDTKHNHLETTFSSNTKLQDGEEYEVSFRARWVAGSNQLNVHAYYGRLARTHRIEVPRQHGTPGAPNSRLLENTGPTYETFQHAPLLPPPGENVTVSVAAADPHGVESVTLHYAEGGGGFVSVPMEDGEDGVWKGTVPGMAAGSVVQFYIEGKDALGALSWFPADGRDSHALYIVDDGRGTDLPVHEIRLIMKEEDFDFMFDRLNLISNERQGCSLLLDGTKFVYDTGVRLKGSPAGRARDGALYQGFNIAFPPEQLYRGLHSSVSIDRSGRAPRAGDQDEVYVKHLFNRAGIPGMFDDLGYIVSPTSTHTSTALFSMARYGRVFTNSQFEDGDLGSVFNLEITYDPTTTVGGRETVKNPVPFSHGGATDFRDLGDDKEQYRWAFEMRTGRRADDYEGLMAFCQTMDLPKDQLARKIDEVMNVDAWMRAAAMHNLCGIGDTWWNNGLQHNLRLYVPGDGRGVVGLPWDLDFVFTGGVTASIKSAGGNLRRVMDIPVNTRLYHGHLLDIIDTAFNPDYMERWLTHYGSKVGQNYSSSLNYIRRRSEFVRGRVEDDSPPVKFAITTNGGASLTTEQSLLKLEGDGWVNVRTIRRAGESEALNAVWTSSKTWEVTVPLVSGMNEIVLEAYDFRDQFLDSDGITITSTATEATPFEHLRITELHYHPVEDEDTEFIELHNLSDQPLDLSGVVFTDGIDFRFAAGASLAPLSYGVLVRDEVAFEQRYGSEVRVLGVYGLSSSLSNGGERVELFDGEHRILAFTYRDDWIDATDGGGRSLELRDPSTAPASLGDATAWAASGAEHGSPGEANGSSTDGGDPAIAWVEVTLEDAEFVASYRRPAGSSDTIQLSSDLEDWQTTILDHIDVIPLGEDEELVTIRIPREEKTQYVRIIAP